MYLIRVTSKGTALDTHVGVTTQNGETAALLWARRWAEAKFPESAPVQLALQPVGLSAVIDQ